MFNNHLSQVNQALQNKFSAVINYLIQQNRIDFQQKNLFEKLFQSNIATIENNLNMEYNGNIPAQAIDSAIENFINAASQHINQYINMNQVQQPNIINTNPLFGNQQAINPMVSSNPLLGNSQSSQNSIYSQLPITENVSGYDIGIEDPEPPSIPIQQENTNLNANIFNKSKKSDFFLKPDVKKISKFAKMKQNTNNIMFDKKYEVIDKIDTYNELVDILDSIRKSSDKLKQITQINPPKENNEIIINDKDREIKINNDKITSINLSSYADDKLMIVNRELDNIYYPWNNTHITLYNLYKDFLKNDNADWIKNIALTTNVTNYIKLNIIKYHEFIPSSESIKLALENFKIIDEDVIKPFYIKNNQEFLVDYINELLQDNIRLYNEEFNNYGKLESIDDFQEMIIAYNDNTSIKRNDLIVYYLNIIAQMIYKNKSFGNRYYIKKNKIMIFDDNPNPIYYSNNNFIIEDYSCYQDKIIESIFKNNKDIFSVYYVNNIFNYKITPIFINKDFSEFVLFYQHI